MNYGQLKPETRAVAEKVLTQKQLDVFRLWCNGLGTARIATMVGVSEPVARRTLYRAQQLIRIELTRFP